MINKELSVYATKLIHHKSRQLVGTAGIVPDDLPDIQQDLASDLVKRLARYDPAKAKENTFVCRVVRHKVSRILRHRRTLKRRLNRPFLSLQELVDDGDGGVVERSQTVPDDGSHLRPPLRIEVAEVLARLTPEQRRTCELLGEKSVTDAAQELGVHRCTLHTRILALRQAFVDAGFEIPRHYSHNRSNANRVEKQ